MNIKRIMAAAFCAAAMLPAFAVDQYLHIRTASGWEIFNLEQVDRMSFSGETMTLADASNKTVATFSRSALDKMVVNNDETTGIAATPAESAEPTFTVDTAAACALMLADGAFEIYRTDGTLILNIPNVKKGETIAFGAIQPGALILRSGNYSFKAIVK